MPDLYLSRHTSLIDTHCHIDFPVFDSARASIFRQCAAKHISTLVVPGVNAAQWPALLQLLEKPAPVRLLGALGMHPLFREHHRGEHLDQMEYMLSKEIDNIVAVGEIGLDFYHGKEDEKEQTRWLISQLKIARQFNKPVIIHSRKAHDTVCKLVRQTRFEQGGIIHAFSGSLQQARALISLGFFIGAGGAITYPRATRLRKLIQTLPLTSLVLETDAPDMPLHEQQSACNSPENLTVILDTLCTLRHETREVIIEQLHINSCQALQLCQSL